MTQITNDHVEWAVVGRLRLMLEEPPHKTFSVTETYALFTTVLCWVLQRIRTKAHEIKTVDDKIAHNLLRKFEGTAIADDPWLVHVVPTSRIELLGAASAEGP